MRHIIAALLLIVLATPAWAGFDEGVAAYDRGDYATALREWRPLAEQGHVLAQYKIGTMYSQGVGVRQDYVEATKWLRKAARQGYPEAQFVLGFLYGAGVNGGAKRGQMAE